MLLLVDVCRGDSACRPFLFQCFTHRYLGWKINVHDSCDVSEASPAASEKREVYAEPDQDRQDLEYGASIAVPSKVTPTAEFLHQQHAHHSHREYGHRYPHHHSTTNSKLSVLHPQLLTNANNNYDRLQSSSSSPENSYGADAHRADEETLPQQQQQQKSQQKQQHRSTTIVHEPSSSLHAGTHLTELAREIQDTATNQELSNLVADHQRPPLSHGTRLPYVTAAISNTQLPFSRAPHHYASNYHHYVRHQLPPPPPRYYHQPEPPRTQLMIIRRPVALTRHPMLQTLQQAANSISSALSLPFPFSFPSSSPRPILIERKKSVYRPPVAITTLKTTPRTTADKPPPSEKLAAKIDTKQRAKLEAKVGSDILDNHLGLTSSWKLLKPARNTGFDPDSIVIESGFKPIIRNVVDRAPDVAQKRLAIVSGSWQDGVVRKNGDYRTIDEFSPVFVPSLPVTTSAIDGSRKRKKTSPARTSQRLDDLDDMEMAADLRLDTYYLPPIARTRPEELPAPSSSGVLITYDGKKLRDLTGLARSISDVEHRGKGRLTSDILSRTPQFGRFQGELPPLIPGEMRANSSIQSSPYGKKNRLPVVDLPPRELLPKTRLKLVERSKRSPLDVGRTMSSTDFQRDGDRGRRERDRVKSVSAGTRFSSLGWVVLIVIAARLAI